MGISVLRLCLNEECRAPFRPENDSFLGHVCVLCREAMRLENFARCLLREKKAEPPSVYNLGDCIRALKDEYKRLNKEWKKNNPGEAPPQRWV